MTGRPAWIPLGTTANRMGRIAGANVVQVASVLVKNGVPHLGRMRADLEAWMDKRGFGTIDDFRGTLSQRNVPDPSAFERGNYMKILRSWRVG